MYDFFPTIPHLSAQDILALMMPRRPPSKHRPFYDGARGPEAAMALRLRKTLSRAHGSSLRKLQRIRRIEAGLRPKCYGRREW